MTPRAVTPLDPLRVGVLMVGSLLWDDHCVRRRWRDARLLLDGAIHVPIPVRYGRISPSRNRTFTMTIDPDAEPGVGLVAPAKTPAGSRDDLICEAEWLWAAERKQARDGTLGAAWGSACVAWHPDTPPDVRRWLQGTLPRPAESLPLSEDRTLSINPWSLLADPGELPFDVVLAAATEANIARSRATPADVASAWASRGSEEYFFNNRRHGLTSAADDEIWTHLQLRRPDWKSRWV